MADEYTTLEKAQDARDFAESRFGKHYLKRLKQLRAEARSQAEDLRFPNSYRAHQSTRAAVYGAEIEYFQIAQTIQTNQGLMDKLRAKLTRKEAEPKEV